MKLSKKTKVMLGVAWVVIVFVALFPLFWMMISSFKPEAEVQQMPVRIFPQEWTIENYQTLLEDGAYIRSLLMTMLGGALFSLGGIAVNAMAAFVFARLDFRFKRFLWVFVLMTMFIPWMSIFVTSFIVVHSLGMLNTLSVLVVPGLAAAIHVFFFRQFFLGFPKSLEEAAIIDGCSRFGVFLRIFIPNSLAIIVIVGIHRFMAYWNAFVWAVMTISQPYLYTVMQVLSYFRSDYGNDWGIIMAGSAVAGIPPLIFLLIFQRHIVQGVKIAGMK